VTVGPLSLAGVEEQFALSRPQMPSSLGSAGSLAGEWNGANGEFAASLAEATGTSVGIAGLVDPSAGEVGAATGAYARMATNSTPGGGSDVVAMLVAEANNLARSQVLSSTSGVTSSGAGNSGAGGVTGANAVAVAERYLGTPYLWGGESPSGFDCSGLVQYAYGQLGISLPRTSQQQATVGAPVAGLASAQPGDLVFFAGSDGSASAPGHVGIYIGNGEMVDAPYTGEAVRVEQVPADQVVAVRRVLPAAVSVQGPAATGAGGSGSAAMGNVSVPLAYAGEIGQAAASNGIPASLLAALLSQESGFDPRAVSSAGAQGIAQFMPSTAAAMGIDPMDPSQSISGAAQLLGSYTRQFGSYADALAAYNAGPSAVVDYGGIPPYAETQAYVTDVLSSAALPASPVGSAS
jgi:peptidoglycan DL-endopeptidase CwlO